MRNNNSQSKGEQKQSSSKNDNSKRNAGNNENKYDLEGILKTSKLTEAETHIKNLLTNKLLYEEAPLDETIFKSDLVIKLNVPTQEYIRRNNKMELGSIIRKFPKTLLRSYEAAYDGLYQDMLSNGDDAQREDNNDKQLLIRQFASFVPLDKYEVQRKRFHDENEDESSDQPTKFTRDKRVVLDSGDEEIININCREELSGYLDAFTISYNTFIYSLQQFCGFKTRSFMVTCFNKDSENESVQINKVTSELNLVQEKNRGVTRTIYILLYLPDQAMIKTANKYHIKKEVDYMQVDPFLNDPMDDANREVRYHSSVVAYLLLNKHQNVAQESIKVLAKLTGVEDEDFNKKIEIASKKIIEGSIADETNSFRKKMDRKVGLRLPNNVKGTAIVNETQISRQQIQRYVKFKEDLEKQLKILIGDEQKNIEKHRNIKNYCYFNDPDNQDAITPQERSYLYQINRGKVNPGVQKMFVQIKKQRKYFAIVRALSHKYGYETFEMPTIYAEFRLVSKKNKFFNRLEKILLYKQQIVSPYGELALFNKMERIKLSYLVLKESIRVQNLYMLDSQVFALTDDYEKFGRIGKKASKRFHYQYINADVERVRDLQGGLNGRNLKNDWHKILAWKTNFYTIRNYLGEAKGFEVFIKTRLIQLFLILTPFGVGAEILKYIVVDPNSQNAGYFPQFWFYIAYMALITVVYGFFTEKYRRAEQNYIQNFVENSPNVEFMNEYRGPYMRDKSNDNANTYNETFISLKDRIKTYLVFFLFFVIVLAEIGFYYGIRQAIVELSYKVAEFNSTNFHYLMPIHLLMYFIYFLVNALLYRYVISGLAHWLTKFENRPTKYSYVHSENLKQLIFIVGTEMIGPIDLVFIQYAAKTTCSSEWCPKEIRAYVYCRYIIMVFFTCISAIDMVRRYLRKKRIEYFAEKKEINELGYSRRLALFLEFIYKQSKKDPCSDINLVDETIALIHFATFLSIFPLSPGISLISMGIAYNVERLEILNNQQRPIAKTEPFDTYRKIVTAIGHWMLFFNFSHMFISLEWLEYLFPDLVLAIVSKPSPYSVMTLKYSIILLFMIAYEVLMKVTMAITSRYHSVMDKRKWNMYDKHEVKILNSGNTIVLKEPKPLHSISRAYSLNANARTSKEAMYNDNDQDQIPNEANTEDNLNKKWLRGSGRKENY